MRLTTRGARLSAVLCAVIVAASALVTATPARAASTLDRTGRFAIQWWTIDDGLPEAPVNGVAFAPDGTLYCTTPTRIVRFDGNSFEPLSKALTNPVQEAIGGFSNIGFDREGRLWVQGGRAAAMLHEGSLRSGRRRWTVHVHPQGRFNSLAFSAAGQPVLVGPNEVLAFDGKRFQEVANVVRNDKRVLWRYGDIDPKSGELWLWGDTLRPGDLRRASISREVSKPLVIASDMATGGDVISMSFCSDGPLALLPECGVVRNATGWQRLPPILPDADYRRSGKISWTADGTIWISSHNGIIACRDGVAEQVISGLPGFSLRTGAIVGDRQDGIWVACFGGLLAVRRTALHVEAVTDCRAAFERADGSLLVGSPGIVAALAPVGSVRPIGTLAGASVPTAILEDAAGRVWVGTQDNFILRVEGGRVTQVTKPAEPFREFRNINALACDASGRVWAATANGLAVHDEKTDSFRTINPDDRTAQTVVIGLAAEADGSMLAAIQSRGVERIGADGSRSPILTAADMPGRRMIVFRRDSRGSLWIGGERGLVRHRAGTPPLRLSMASGLVDDTIRQIEEDQSGRLWIATRSGHLQGLRLDDLDRLDSGELAIVRGVILGPLDGLGDAECVGRMGRSFREEDQRLEKITVPVTNGVVRFVPATVPSATLAGVAPLVTRDADVPYGFRFATPGLHWATPPLHQTRLSGVDDAWSPSSQADRRDYASLPPGEHVFEVRSIAGETDRDFPIASLPVTVAAPWWRRPVTLAGFGTALAVTAATIARELTRRRSRRVIEALEWQRAMDRERARIARDIHDSLGAGLTRMAMMSDLARKGAMPQTNLPDRLDAIYRNARSLARSVDEIVWAVNPRNDTVAQFTSYVVQDVEEFVHAGDLSLRLDVPDRPGDERPLSTHVRHHVCLAIREALQNVLRHAEATHVDFSIRVDESSMNVVIRDDGVGFATDRPPAAEQDGLANMRHRLGAVGGSVAIASAPHSGTTVTFHVPVDFRRNGAGATPLEVIHDS
jgi:signal transduction histidine kinase/streptogramin lyase